MVKSIEDRRITQTAYFFAEVRKYRQARITGLA